MSARLIKNGTEKEAAAEIASFAFPEGRLALSATVASGAVPLFSSAGLAVTTPKEETNLALDRQQREEAIRVRQQEITAEVDRLTNDIRSQFQETLAELASLRTALAARSERELVRLAIEISKKIVHREVTTDKEVVVTLARMALSRLQNRTVARVHLHPDDFDHVNAHLERLEGKHSIELVNDPSVQTGGCLIETELGDVDARIEQQFSEIERALLGA